MSKHTPRSTPPAPRVQGFHYNGLSFSTQKALGQHIAPLVGRSLSFCLGKLYEFGNDAEQLVRHFQQTDDINGRAVLMQELLRAMETEGLSRMDDLTVLSDEHDPYRFDTARGRAEGQWFADVIARLIPLPKHLRVIHYVLVSSTAKVLKPDGTPYTNTFENWVWLLTDASAAGRWLGYVPFEMILDERNDPPVLPDDDDDGEEFGTLRPGLAAGISGNLPDLDLAMPSIEWTLRPHRQPYRIILFGEKSSLAPVLRPIRDRVNGELLLPTGESTTTMVFNLVKRIIVDGRPAVIGYFSDFDPSGWQMAISVARKLQALRTLLFPTLDVRLYPVALNYEQAIRFTLPSTPLAKDAQGKFKDKRAAKWLAAWDREQTEIDALAAVNPALLTGLAEDFIRPFFDPALPRRTAAVAQRARNTATARFSAHPQYRASREAVEAALAKLSDANNELAVAQDAALEALGDVRLPPVPALPQPVIKATAPEPLFTTDDGYVTATRKLKQHRALYPDDDD